MAKYFVYPLGGQSPAYALASGEIANTAGLPFTANASVTNHIRLTDDSITSAASFQAQWDAVRFDKGGAATNSVTAIAFHCSAADASNGIRFSTSASTDNSETDIRYTLSAVDKGWNVKSDITASGTDRYWYAVAHEGTLSVVTEIIIGVKLDLTNVILGGSEGVNYGNDVMISSGGNEFSNQRHGAKKFWNLKLRHVSSTVKSNLETMREAVDGSHHNFIYYDDNVYNYVSMSDDSLRFKEIAFGVYDTSIKLTEVL